MFAAQEPDGPGGRHTIPVILASLLILWLAPLLVGICCTAGFEAGLWNASSLLTRTFRPFFPRWVREVLQREIVFTETREGKNFVIRVGLLSGEPAVKPSLRELMRSICGAIAERAGTCGYHGTFEIILVPPPLALGSAGNGTWQAGNRLYVRLPDRESGGKAPSLIEAAVCGALLRPSFSLDEAPEVLLPAPHHAGGRKEEDPCDPIRSRIRKMLEKGFMAAEAGVYALHSGERPSDEYEFPRTAATSGPPLLSAQALAQLELRGTSWNMILYSAGAALPLCIGLLLILPLLKETAAILQRFSHTTPLIYWLLEFSLCIPLLRFLLGKVVCRIQYGLLGMELMDMSQRYAAYQAALALYLCSVTLRFPAGRSEGGGRIEDPAWKRVGVATLIWGGITILYLWRNSVHPGMMPVSIHILALAAGVRLVEEYLFRWKLPALLQKEWWPASVVLIQAGLWSLYSGGALLGTGCWAAALIHGITMGTMAAHDKSPSACLAAALASTLPWLQSVGGQTPWAFTPHSLEHHHGAGVLPAATLVMGPQAGLHYAAAEVLGLLLYMAMVRPTLSVARSERRPHVS